MSPDIAQLVQLAERGGATLPSLHGPVQFEELELASPYRPAGQSWHWEEVSPTPDQEPAGQAKEAPAKHQEPAGQGAVSVRVVGLVPPKL